MAETESKDRVIVVGAGPAGAATALALARKSIPVVLVERTKFPRRKVCGEYLGAGAVAELDALGLGDAVRAQAAPLRGVRIVATDVQPLELVFPRSALSICREHLDALVLDAAIAAGATLIHARAEDLLFNENRSVSGIVVQPQSGDRKPLHGRFVVGADGLSSIVARKLALTCRGPRRPRFAIGGHYRGFGDLGGFVEMHVARNGYFAVNPLSSDLANVMAVSRKDALAAWSRLMERASEQRVGARVSIGPLAHRVRRAAGGGALLVGDASGFVDPFTGQGVYLALRGARRAAAALTAVVTSPDEQAPAFSVYERGIRSELRARMRLALVVDTLLRFPPLGRRAASRLIGSSELTATMLEALAGTTSPGGALSFSFLRRLLL